MVDICAYLKNLSSNTPLLPKKIITFSQLLKMRNRKNKIEKQKYKQLLLETIQKRSSELNNLT